MTPRVVRDGLLLAVGTLTALPVPPPRAVDREVARAAMTLAAVPGLLLAGAWVAVSGLGHVLGLPGAVAGPAAVAVLLLATRAFHVDGLADTVDGLTASCTADRSLEVMRTGDVGPAGAAALVVVLGLDAACLGLLHERGDQLLGVVAVVTSRAVLALACRRGLPAARPEGLGALVAGTIGPARLGLLGIFLTAAVAAASGLHGAIVVISACAATELVLRHARRRVGGVTGDVLGATVEIALATGLLAAVSMPG